MPTVKSLVSLLAFFAISQSSLRAQSIVLKNARSAPTPIAIQAFMQASDSAANNKLASDLEAALTADLIFSRLFKVMGADALEKEGKVTGDIGILQVDIWRQLGAQYVVRAKVNASAGEPSLVGYVFDVITGKPRITHTYKTSRKDVTVLAHQFGDDIVELVTGQKGLFSTKITFVYEPPGRKAKSYDAKVKEIWTVDFNGRNAVPLVQNGRTNLNPAWSADGKYVYYTSSSLIHWNIWKTDMRGKSSQVTNYKGSALGPLLLPNGKEMVASLSKDGNPDLYLMDLGGQVKKRLTTHRGLNIAPSASPDGKKICFASDRLGNLHVFTLDLQSLDIVRLTRVGTLNDSCAWNPTENLILFSGMDTDRDFDIFAMNDQGNEMERLTYDAKNNENPSWSPDGKLVVFASRRAGKYQIYIMKADGTQITPIIDLPGEGSQPAWSPRMGY